MLDLDKLYQEPVYRKRWHQLWWGKLIIAVIALIFILAILVAISAYTQYQKLLKEQANANNQIQTSNTSAIVEGGSNNNLTPVATSPNIASGIDESAIVGSTSQATTSAISLIEFSDFACPFCKATYPIIKVLIAKYPDKINFTYRDFPIHDQSIALALAARCSGEQGKFWPMHDWLFDNQDDLVKLASDNLANSLIDEAKRLKLNEASFNSCLSSQKYLPNIAKDYKDGETLGISGTPTMFLKIPGRQNYIKLEGQLSDQDAQNIENVILSLK